MGDPTHSPGLFPPTHWSVILSAQGDEALRRRAVEELLGTYWKPLYVYLRRRGRDPHVAEDLIQGFYERLLGRDFLAQLDPARGRFRSYLRSALDRYVINVTEYELAQRRGGGQIRVALEAEAGERELAISPDDPGRAYDRVWAREVLARALGALRSEYAGTEREGALEIALRFFEPVPPPTYAEASTLACMTLAQFRSFLHRVRVRYRELIARQVAPTLDPGHPVEDEVRELMASLGS